MNNRIYKLAAGCAMLLGLAGLASCSDNDEPNPSPDQPAVIEIEFLKQWEAYYFRPNYNNDPNKPTYSNYFVEIAQGNVGTDGFLSYPMTEGEYLLDLDLNVLGLSDSPNNPYIPAGTYKPTNSLATNEDVDYTFNLKNTMLIKNESAIEEGSYKFHYYTFYDGEIKIERDGNNYTIDCTFTCTLESSDAAADGTPATEPQKIHATFKGAIDVTNPSPDSTPYNYEKPIDATTTVATATRWEDSNADNYILRCFTSKNLTSDGIHVNEPGMKFQFSLYSAKNSGIAGTYTLASTKEPGTADIGKRWAAEASGCFAEVVNDNMTVQYALLESGKLTITEKGDGTYTITADCIDTLGHTVKMQFEGSILTGKLIIPATSLREDVVFNAQMCTDVMTFGSLMKRGTTNVWVSLADETRVLLLDMILPGEDVTEIPEGRYAVRSGTEAMTAIPGSIDYDGGQSYINPTAYLEYTSDGSAVKNYAAITSGWIDIKRSGDMYTFTYELYDNYSSDLVTPQFNKISGTVTTPVPAFRTSDETRMPRNAAGMMLRHTKVRK